MTTTQADKPMMSIASHQGDLLTILYSQLLTAHDVVDQMRGLGTDPLMRRDIENIYEHICNALEITNQIRP